VRPLAGVVLLLLAAAYPAEARTDRPPTGRAARAQRLYDEALGYIARSTIEARRLAIADLEQATLIDPGNPEIELTLARVYYQAGFLKNARLRFERVARLAPTDADARFGLGQVWRRDWLKYLEPAALDRAVENFSTAARLRSDQCDPWLMLVPLLLEQHNLGAASAAAEHAADAAPERPEAELALAMTSYRSGQAGRAADLFRRAIPRLPKLARERFEDISPVASEQDTVALHRLDAAGQREFVRRFWREHDPDLTTPESEAQLEYWARVTQAYFLFFDAHRREWDERGEVYVRYGPPEGAEYNPLGERLSVRFGTVGEFPANVLRWDYPSLGMTVTMQDRLLSEYYLLPITRDYDPDPRPDPDSLAARSGSLATRGGRGVFPRLPPGVRPLPVEGAITRFEAAGAPRLLAQIETPGGPGGDLRAEWVVVDSAQHEVARAGRELSPSPCDATELRVADFATELPAGRYTVGIAVNDEAGRRGVYRENVTLGSPAEGLALSDVAVSCGSPPVGERTVRLAPNPAARVEGSEPLVAYFEVYRLRPGSNGQSRFQYVYTVRSAEKDPRIWIQRLLAPRAQPPEISASREEENAGPLRRQFVSVPVQSLPPGRYWLEITVRDLIAGTEAGGRASFVRPGPEPLRN